jgi:hypothetical protein
MMNISNNGTNIQPSTQQSFLFTLHVSTTMGHLQMFSIVFIYTSFEDDPLWSKHVM